jgi:hypothetical protein
VEVARAAGARLRLDTAEIAAAAIVALDQQLDNLCTFKTPSPMAV